MEIVQFAQMQNEPFHDAWDCFKSLQQQCPHHHFPLQMLYQTFYDGLERNFQYMLDNAARGGIGNCTAQDLSNIFEVLATSSQQKGARPYTVQSHGNFRDFEHGENMWQHEANFKYMNRVHVNATYAFKPQVFDSLPQDCDPSWRPNPTFKWQLDDNEEEPIWCGEDDAGEQKQVYEDALPSPPKGTQAAIFYGSSETDKMGDDWEIVEDNSTYITQLSVEENSTREDVATELGDPIMAEDADELCYPDRMDEQGKGE